jgi:spermidine synthase
MVSLGGALGGTVVALVAPRVFPSYLELQLGLVWCGVMAVIVLWNEPIPKVGLWLPRALLVIAVGVLAGYLGRKEYQDLKSYRLTVRNFYGALKVRDDDVGGEFAERNLLHGTINHGNQLLSESKRYTTTSYYGENSGLGRAIRALQERGPVRIGSIGLGAGVTTNYGRAGDYLRVYEINPLVEKIAQTEFTFFPHSAADKKIMMGDARLVLEAQESQQFDILAVDAFSSDAIPIHLLTREALALYFRHLKPNGVLALHISNRYLDLAPVCAAGAKFFNKKATVVADDGEGGSYLNSSTWVLVTSDTTLLDSATFQGANTYPAALPEKFRPWTDDYSNIVQILNLN